MQKAMKSCMIKSFQIFISDTILIVHKYSFNLTLS